MFHDYTSLWNVKDVSYDYFYVHGMGIHNIPAPSFLKESVQKPYPLCISPSALSLGIPHACCAYMGQEGIGIRLHLSRVPPIPDSIMAIPAKRTRA